MIRTPVLALAAVLAPICASAAPPTFAKDVAPILYHSCVSCHRPGEVAPMSLISYQDVRPWAKAIRKKVESREMPPWGADPRFGKWKDDRSLSADAVDTIVKWVDAGAPRGNDSDLPKTPSFSTGWSHGDPDVVIEMPVDFRVPAEGEVPVIDFFTRTPFAQDVYVKALEVRPSTPGVVHHAGLYVVDKLPEGASSRAAASSAPTASPCRGTRSRAPTAARRRKKSRSCCPTCRDAGTRNTRATRVN